MDESFFKFLTWCFIIVVAWAIFSGGCSKKQDRYNVEVQTMVSAADGLDLQAVGDLLKRAKTAEQLEKLLNDSGEGINNLDLDENGEVDYVQVEEYGSGNSRGFSLTVETSADEEQEVATIEIEKSGNEADVQIHGNSHVYGANHYHRSRFGFGDYLLLSYMFRPHPFYMSPWGYGYHPSYYRPYRTVSTTAYRNRTSSARSSAGMTRTNNNSLKSRARSPNAGKTASNIRAPLKSPTASQKSFQSRNPSKSVRSGGFGKSRPSRPSTRGGSMARSSSGFRGK